MLEYEYSLVRQCLMTIILYVSTYDQAHFYTVH